MIKSFYFIKKNFPATYALIRKILFPIVHFTRNRKSSNFTHPIKKTVTIFGYTYTIHIDPTNGFIDTQIFTTGQYELDILSVIKQHLNPGEVFIDIGGNIGWHTLFAAQVVGKAGHVYTFEPIKKLVSQLTASVTDNNLTNQVTVFPFGCSSSESQVDLHINSINIGGSSVYTPSAQSTKTETIMLKKADGVLATINQPIALIKIDTEGSELAVLQGLAETLKRYRPKLIIEYSPSFWGAESFNKSVAFFEILAQHNYSIYDLESGHQQIDPSEKWIRNFTKLQTNFLCLPQT